MTMDLRRLRYLVALADHGSFARAAAAVGLTQPALSRSLQALEASIGAKLVDRGRSGAEATAVGTRLIEQARPLLAQVDEIERDLELVIGLGGGLLRVGAGPFPAEISVGKVVGRLIRQHPGLRVDFSVDDWPNLTRRLLAGELDVVVAETSVAQHDDRLAVDPLPAHDAVVFCRTGHPLAGREHVTVGDMRRFPFVMTSIPERLATTLGMLAPARQREATAGTTITSQVRVTTAFLARQIVMESDGLSAALPRQIADDVAAGRLVHLPIELPELRTGYGVLRLARRTPAPAVAAFIELLQVAEREL